jgi:hypothetical protein
MIKNAQELYIKGASERGSTTCLEKRLHQAMHLPWKEIRDTEKKYPSSPFNKKE